MGKRDLKTELRPLYFPSAKAPALVDVPRLSFLMTDGEGSPTAGTGFQYALNALYGLAYTLKFALKKARLEFTVMPLEALWWNAGSEGFDMDRKGDWLWTAMIAIPDEIRRTDFRQAVAAASAKKPDVNYAAVRLEPWKEGRCAQILHIGPYAAERPTIERLHAFIEAEGFRPRGKHHEIYLGDPRRTTPEKLKTVVRQPVERR
jgi:hypothetical protein